LSISLVDSLDFKLDINDANHLREDGHVIVDEVAQGACGVYIASSEDFDITRSYQRLKYF